MFEKTWSAHLTIPQIHKTRQIRRAKKRFIISGKAVYKIDYYPKPLLMQ